VSRVARSGERYASRASELGDSKNNTEAELGAADRTPEFIGDPQALRIRSASTQEDVRIDGSRFCDAYASLWRHALAMVRQAHMGVK
jgi:hypothetical protein